MQRGTSFVRDFEVLRPAAATRCTDGVIFSPNIAKYQPIAWDGNKAKKLKILTKFYQFSPYRLLNASHWPIPYTTFTKFSEFVGSFVLDHGSGRFDQGVPELKGFNLVWLPQILSPPSGENVRLIDSLNILDVQERARGLLSSCQVRWSSDFARCQAGGAKIVEFFV